MRNKLSKLIDAYQNKEVSEKRNYIGASSIGSECLRQIWYQYKGFDAIEVPSKTRRTWDIGKRLEGLIIEWIIKSGIEVLTFDVIYSSSNVAVFQGHIDLLVVINKKNYILEIKTAKDASFKVFVNKGLNSWNPQYYAQIQSYMGMSGILSACILVLNKDNSDLCDEVVLFDWSFYKKLEDKALMISEAVIEPPRINGSPLFFKCKLCQFNKVCHE